MRICDKCKNKIKDYLHIDLQVRGECRRQLYDLGMDSTNFEFCSIQCAIDFLIEAKALIKLKPSQFQNYEGD